MSSPFSTGETTPGRARQLECALNRELELGETLLWSGFPRQGLLLRGEDVLMIPFSLMWGGFAIFWETQVIEENAPLMFKLWGIPFVAMGLWIIAGRFFADALGRTATIYGVTNRRVLISSGVFSRQTSSLALASLSEINIREKNDGSGTLTFGPKTTFSVPRGWPGYQRNSSPNFEGIAQVRNVLRLIRDAQNASAEGRG